MSVRLPSFSGAWSRKRGPFPLALTLCLSGTVWFLSGCATFSPAPSPPEPPTFTTQVDALLAEPPFDRVHWGFLAVDAMDGTVLYERNADLLFVPASNMKVPVTAAALGLLGPVFRWETNFYTRGFPFNGVLEADLYLVGSGDPTLGAPFYTPPEWALNLLADTLRAAGIQRVIGGLTLDASAWDSTSVPSSWMVGNLDPTYGATGGVFSVRRGELEVQVEGGEQVGWPTRVTWAPLGFAPFIENDLSTVGAAEPAEVHLTFLPETRRWRVSGGLRVGERRSFSVAARDPVRVGIDALNRTLADQGVAIREGTQIVWAPGVLLEDGCYSGTIPGCPGMRRVAGRSSPPLIDVAQAILAPSQNWMAEQLVRTLGAERGERGSWEEGFRVIHEYLEAEVRVGRDALHFRDGSGLSAYNLASPRALVRILAHAREQPWGTAFRNALAQPGAENSTLSQRLPGLEGRVFAKTGTISHVNALSGILLTDDGREVLFSILTNASNLPAERVRDRIDALVRVLAAPEG